VGALSFIRQGEKIPARSLVAGNPARIIKPVSDEMMNWKSEGTSIYQQLPQQCQETLKICEPLNEVAPQQFTSPIDYKPFKKS